MTKVNLSTSIGIPPEQLWDFIGKFETLPDWHPAVETSELAEEGSVRRLKLVGGGTIVERLERIDEDERLYSYSIVDSPLPVANYKATIRVRDEAGGERSIVEWSSEFDAAGASDSEAIKAIQDVYQTGLDNLKKLYGG